MIVIAILIKANDHTFRSSAMEVGLTILVPFSSVYDFALIIQSSLASRILAFRLEATCYI